MNSNSPLIIETKSYREHNLYSKLMIGMGIIISIGGIVLLIYYYISHYYDIYKNFRGFLFSSLAFFTLFLCGIFIVSISWFKQPQFYIYKDKFSIPRMNLRDFLRKKIKVIQYSSIRRIEIEKRKLSREDFGLKGFRHIPQGIGYLCVVYTTMGKWIELTYADLENEAVEKLMATIKEYFEKEKNEVEWSDKVSPLMARRDHCKRIKEKYGE